MSIESKRYKFTNAGYGIPDGVYSVGIPSPLQLKSVLQVFIAPGNAVPIANADFQVLKANRLAVAVD